MKMAQLGHFIGDQMIVYEEEYILPFLKNQVKLDFGYEIKDNTHIKLLLKKKGE